MLKTLIAALLILGSILPALGTHAQGAPPEIVCEKCPIKTTDPSKAYASDYTGQFLRELKEPYSLSNPPYRSFTPERLYAQAIENERKSPKAPSAGTMATEIAGSTIAICSNIDTRCDPPVSIQGATVTLADGTKLTMNWTVITPFDAKVTFGGEVVLGERYWKWIKAGEPAKQCTAAQAADKAAYQWGCARRIGEVLFVSQRFKKK